MNRFLVVLGLVSVYFSSNGQSNVSVDPLTGRPRISIPLGQIGVNDVQVPVSIWHHGNSLRVAESEGSCGMGWEISVGGSVSRQVRGLPDDYNVTGDTRKGWLFNSNAQAIQNFTPTADDNLAVCTDETTDYTFMNGLAYLKDPEPDVFYFNAPGLSGKFVLGTDGTAKLIPYQDISITINKDTNGIITGFVITNATGMTYTFGGGTTVKRTASKLHPLGATPDQFVTDYNLYSTEVAFQSEWNLSTLYSTATSNTASFSYQNTTTSYSPDFRTRISSAQPAVTDTLYMLTDVVSGMHLTGVSIGNYSISLQWNDRLVNSITISESATNSSKEFDFLYKTLASDAMTFSLASKIVYRSFLSDIRQQNSCISAPSYQFSYSGVDLINANTLFQPWRTQQQQDYFGFYNAQGGNTGNVPTVYFYQNESDGRRFRIHPIPGVTPTQVLNGDDRSVNTTWNSFGALTRIDYPTGGSTLITYESNTYFDSSTGEEFQAGGVRVKKIMTHAGEAAYGRNVIVPSTGRIDHTAFNSFHLLTTSYQYVQVDGTSSGRMLYPPSFAWATGTDILRSQNNLAGDDQTLYTRVIETRDGQGSRVYEYSIPGTYPSLMDNDWIATKSKTARNSCSGTPNFKNGAYTFPFPPVTDYSFAQGLLKRVREYSGANVLVSEKRYTYTRSPLTPVILKGLRYELVNGAFQYGSYQMLTGTTNVVTSEIEVMTGDENASDSLKVTTAYQYNSHNMPTLVTRTGSDGSISKTQTQYALSFTIATPSATDVQAVAINALNNSMRYGEVIEQIQKTTPAGGTETVSGAQLVVFKNFGNGQVLPYQVKQFPGGSFTVSTTDGTTFTSDAGYRLKTTNELYDSKGFLLDQIDYQKNRSSTHYIMDQSLPVAAIANARASEVVYESFEGFTNHGLALSAASVTPSLSWTGNRSAQLTSSGSLPSITLVDKGSNTYRVSCWVNAAQNSTVYFKAKNGATVISSVTLSYAPPSLSTWTYLEGTLDATNVASPFTLEITSNASIQIDDIIALPQAAALQTQTHQPLTGVTSQTDNRGNSVVYTYDDLGRKVNTLDRKRNLVEVKEYLLQVQGNQSVQAGFTSSSAVYTEGVPVTFTALPNCGSVTYEWKVDGVTHSSTSSTAVITFSSMGAHNVTLTVTSASFGSATYSETVCVQMGTPTFKTTISPSAVFHKCSVTGEGVKTFGFTPLTGCPISANFNWEYTDASGSNWLPASTWGTASGNQLIGFTSPQYSYTMRVVLTLTCPNTDISYCAVEHTKLVTLSWSVQYINDSPCP